jgi:hypothetical protein
VPGLPPARGPGQSGATVLSGAPRIAAQFSGGRCFGCFASRPAHRLPCAAPWARPTSLSCLCRQLLGSKSRALLPQGRSGAKSSGRGSC